MRRHYRELLEAAKKIEAAWRLEGNCCTAFPAIALERTSHLDLSPFGNLANLPELLENPAISCLQQPSTFSDLYFKLYDNGKFWVEVLNWWGSDINVHNHNFSGVQFQLRGRSLHVTYRFEEADRIAADLAFGTLSVTSAELWNVGDHSVSLPGIEHPHNVSHLDTPTVSLLIRTHPRQECGGQNNYFAPDIAANYFVADVVFRKKIGALRLLARNNSTDFGATFHRVLAHHTHTENLFTLLKLIDLIFTPERVGLVEEYGSTGTLESRIVRAVAYHRGQQLLANTIKNVRGLTEEEVLVTSVLSCAFSRPSLETILSHLAAGGVQLDISKLVPAIESKLSEALRVQFRGVLELFGLSRAVEVSPD